MVSDSIKLNLAYLAIRFRQRMYILIIEIETASRLEIYPCRPTKRQVRQFKKKYIRELKSILKRSKELGG